MVNYTKYFDLELFEGKISKHQYPWHFHNCYTIILVEVGSITYEFQDTSLKINEAEALIIAPDVIHRNTISKQTVYKALFLPKEYFSLADQNKIQTQILKQTDIVKKLVELFNKIKLNIDKNEINDSIFMLQNLINQLQVPDCEISYSRSNLSPEIDYDLPIDELAEKAHLSKFHFQRKFKKSNGLTIGQLKQQEKTIKAKTLLEKGKMSTDVAYELGFFDQSHFIKYFKKMWATTPKNFK